MAGFKEWKAQNDGHLYGHQGIIVKSQILCNPLVSVAHQQGLEPRTYWLEVLCTGKLTTT